MANNREISQFAGLVTVNDTTNAVTIGSTVSVTGSISNDGNLTVSNGRVISIGGAGIGTDTNLEGNLHVGGTVRYAQEIERMDGVVADQTVGTIYRQQYTTGGTTPRRMGFFGLKRATGTTGDQRASFTMELCPDNSTNLGLSSPAANTEMFEFDYNGRLDIVKSGGGIMFQGGGTANLLDDYEEGTATLTLNSFTGGPHTGTASYTKIGNVVYVKCTWNAGTGYPGTYFQITGLPFSADGTHVGVFANGTYSNNGSNLGEPAYTQNATTNVFVAKLSSTSVGNFWNLSIEYKVA